MFSRPFLTFGIPCIWVADSDLCHVQEPCVLLVVTGLLLKLRAVSIFSGLGREQGCLASSQSVVLCHGSIADSVGKGVHLKEECFFCQRVIFYPSCYCNSKFSMSFQSPSVHPSLKDALVNIVILHIYFYFPTSVTKGLKYTAVRPDIC